MHPGQNLTSCHFTSLHPREQNTHTIEYIITFNQQGLNLDSGTQKRNEEKMAKESILKKPKQNVGTSFWDTLVTR